MHEELSKDWLVEFSESGKKSLAKLDPSVQRLIRKILTAIAATNHPRSRGKVLKGNLAGLWRYRIGDWRVIYFGTVSNINGDDDQALVLDIRNV